MAITILYQGDITLLDGEDVVRKYGRLKVTNTHDLMCGGITNDMTTTCPTMPFI